ncbi:uncharacterized protein LOC141656618 [Silene latifolia]|uniref:uncharacterized protein LOC141656618 n=1 Tax=Silene latifolia TaxID=37657 RepID=UPI003D7820A1
MEEIEGAAILPSSDVNRSKDGNFVPSSSDTGKTKSINAIQGIPVLNLSEGEPEETEGWMLRKGRKGIPVLETIDEEGDVSDLLQFTHEDLKTEVDFWTNSVICYILGANPPWDIVKNYVYRIWDQFGIDRVSFLDNGVFIVQFIKSGGKEALLKFGYYMFDNKPVVIKPWVKDMELVKERVVVVPVWVKLYGIPLKFWGTCLPKIANLVGKYVKMDMDTQDKIRLSFARVMVEKPMDQQLPEKVKFLDESGHVVFVNVEYEWRPISCISCKGIGHESAQCRKPKGKKKINTQGPMPKVKPQQKTKWRPVMKSKHVPADVPTPPILTPTNFPPLHTVRNSPVIKYTPVKQIIRLNRQDGMVGAQHIHMLVHSQTDGKKVLLTMIYAFNGLYERVELWNILKGISADCTDPWLWLGDFNTVLSPFERLGGNTYDADMEHFQDCVSICGMEDIPATGALFTWSNKQNSCDRVYSRLDRVIGNQEWLDIFGTSLAHFHPEGLFDHCPCTIMDKSAEIGGKKSFKYFNMWGAAPTFKDFVAMSWATEYRGTKIMALETIQKALVGNPGDAELLQQEVDLSHELKELIAVRDSFLL